MFQRSRFVSAVSAAAVAAVASTAFAVGPTVVYTNIAASPTSNVPGLSGVKWDASFSFFGINASPSGQYWFLNHQVTGGTNSPDELNVLGSGTAGTVVGQEIAYGITGGRVVENWDSSGRVNDSGQWVVSGDYTGDNTTDDFVFAGNATGPTTLIAQQGSPIPAAYGISGNWRELEDTAVDASGRGYFQNLNASGGTAPYNSIDARYLTSAGATVLRQGDMPTGQGGGRTDALDRVMLDRFTIKPDASSYLARARLAIPTGANVGNDVLIRDGVVILQESYTLASFGVTGGTPTQQAYLVGDSGLNGILGEEMAANGDVYAFGSWAISAGNFVADGQNDWAIKNKQIIATSGSPVIPGSAVTWDNPVQTQGDFQLLTGDGLGNYVLAGFASNGATYVVYNGTKVLLQSNDPIDLNGNGLYDDDLFFSTVEFQEGALGNNGQLFLLVNFINGSGLAAGSGFISIAVPEPTGLCAAGVIGVAALRRRRRK